MSDFRFQHLPEVLTGSEVRIIEYMYKNSEQVPFMPIREIAETLKMSTATLSRFAQRMGYKNLRQLKLSILKTERISPEKKLKNVVSRDGQISVTSLLEREIEYLQATLSLVAHLDIERAVHMTKEAKKIYIYGKGAARGLAYLMEFRLKRYGLNTHLIQASGSEIFEDMIGLSKGDLLIVYGFGKMPIETKILLDYVKQQECNTILFSERSYIETAFQELILIPCYRGEAQEYHSMTSPSALTDIFLLMVGKSMGENSLDRMNRLFDLKEAYRHEMPR